MKLESYPTQRENKFRIKFIFKRKLPLINIRLFSIQQVKRTTKKTIISLLYIKLVHFYKRYWKNIEINTKI